MFQLNSIFDADTLLYLFILNATATQYTCSSTIPTSPTDKYSEVAIVHTCAFQSIILGCHYISVVQTVVVIVTKAVLVPERPLILS